MEMLLHTVRAWGTLHVRPPRSVVIKPRNLLTALSSEMAMCDKQGQ